MTALNLLDVSYYAVTALGWAILTAAVILACVAARGFWLAHEADERDLRTFAHPSNVTVMPHVRPFDFEVDA